jgi:hypothetical protein
MQTARGDGSPEPGLGGKLLYAGELDARGRALLIAANIAGAASLAATADPAAQKQAVRDGVADFLVTDLDEALRILKNQIRKRETVAVCVGAAPQAMEQEMLERGVLPDLLRPADEASGPSLFISEGAKRVQVPAKDVVDGLLCWRVASAPAQWLPKLDALALACLPADAGAARRWLRLAPRYLGRLAQGLRLLRCDRDVYANFAEQMRERVEIGEIAVEVEIQFTVDTGNDLHFLVPPSDQHR